jgi:NitT/TauT family transport system permease protein
MNGRHITWLAPVLMGALLTAVWYALRHAFGVPDWLVPMPHEIAEAMWQQRDVFAFAAWLTTRTALLGFLSAALGALLFALVLGSSRWAHRGLYPFLLILQMTPVIVIAPLIILWAERGTRSIVLITFLVSFFPIVVNTTLGMVSTDRNLVEYFEVCGARWWQRLLLLRLPYATPYYLGGLRIAAALAPVGAIFGEYVTGSMIGGLGGLGFLAQFFNSQQRPAELMGVGVASCTLGFVFLGVIALLNWLLLRRWHDSISHPDT